MTQQWRTTRPVAGEFAPYYAGYIAAVPEGDLVGTLKSQLDDSLATWKAIPAAKENFRYAEGKWTVKQLVNHVIDAERIFAYRALRAARGDETTLPGFDENNYAAAARTSFRPLASLASEFEHLRRANIALFESFDDEEAARRVTASGMPVSARALMWIMAGHERHHAKVLKERYLK